MKQRRLKKMYWWLSARYSAWKYPINNEHLFVGITGTDGKTTTSSFIYELAKAAGYKPFLMTTVSAKFEDKNVETHLKSTSFFAYSVKNVLASLKSLNVQKAVKNLFFLDKSGFEKLTEEHRTTPLASEIRKLIKEYEQKGANFFILEVTSHALDQHRIYGIQFDSIAFTNITNEHLDYHGTWELYAEAKAGLIRHLKPNGGVAINKDDERSYNFLIDKLKGAPYKIAEYSVKDLSKTNPKKFYIHIDQSEEQTVISAIPSGRKDRLPEHSYDSGISIFGDYNIYNALAAFSCCNNISLATPDKLASSLQKLKDITGRMNFLFQSPSIIVDFAHTPNAFEKALSSVKSLVKNNGRLWVVFGCAGLRDHYKRPAMGKAAYDYADNIIITSEDPRTESLNEINKQIIQGFHSVDDEFTIHTYYPELRYEPEEGKKFIVRFDEPNVNSRRNAITFAVENAGKDDIVLMLGKGHETTMCFGTKEYPWNDIEETKRIILNRKSSSSKV
jgi:UDP-N-acetylmuramoyl-L-alanyl-D-glutamate--2,6-diaminopimelate ligase